MVLSETQHLLDENALTTPKAQYCPTVFNFVEAYRTKFELLGVCVLQIVNLYYCGYIHYRQLSLLYKDI